jgi:gamma-glutamyltranspeptidase/glutathione hydrolase
MIIGSAGGSRIIGYVAQRIIALIDWNLSPQDALAMPSILARSAKVDAETGFDPVIVELLKDKGHTIKSDGLNSGLTLIHRQNDMYYGAADPRREGTALGR